MSSMKHSAYSFASTAGGGAMALPHRPADRTQVPAKAIRLANDRAKAAGGAGAATKA